MANRFNEIVRLAQEIPFRIKAEIAYMRCNSGYRLSEAAIDNYKNYFTYHRKKLDKLLEKDKYRELKDDTVREMLLKQMKALV